jgi:hypothetical protein
MPAEVGTDFHGVFVVPVTFDSASLATLTARDEAITVPGVLSTDYCVAAVPPAAWNAGMHVQGARVTANNTVTARIYNSTAGSLDPASAAWLFIIGRV